MLNYHQFLTEAVDQKSALARLQALAKDADFSYGKGIDVNYIFQRPMDNPPGHEWSDIVNHRNHVGGVQLRNVPVDLLIPTQPGVTPKSVAHFIKINPNRWNDDKEDIVNILLKDGKLYVAGGHHRVAAALLMGYRTIPAEIIGL